MLWSPGQQPVLLDRLELESSCVRWRASHQRKGRRKYEMSSIRIPDKIINGVSKIDMPSYTSFCKSAGRYNIIRSAQITKLALPAKKRTTNAQAFSFLFARYVFHSQKPMTAFNVVHSLSPSNIMHTWMLRLSRSPSGSSM